MTASSRKLKVELNNGFLIISKVPNKISNIPWNVRCSCFEMRPTDPATSEDQDVCVSLSSKCRP